MRAGSTKWERRSLFLDKLATIADNQKAPHDCMSILQTSEQLFKFCHEKRANIRILVEIFG